jgi:hypothetical protein
VNLHRVKPGEGIVLVQGYWSVFRLPRQPWVPGGRAMGW